MDRIRYLIGLATLATAGVLGFVLFQLLADENPDGYFPVRLEFADIRGLGPGAEVRYRGVRVGSIREIGLSPDGEKGVVTALLDAEHAELARVSSLFWVVSPRFGGLAGGATGLDTLVRDSYVAFLTPRGDSPPLARSS
ncbi:MAG: MlaD family protein, partial [Planctomycetota bacterium]